MKLVYRINGARFVRKFETLGEAQAYAAILIENGIQPKYTGRARRGGGLPIAYIGHCRRNLRDGLEPLTLDAWRASFGGGASFSTKGTTPT